jgi:hypothetical protein
MSLAGSGHFEQVKVQLATISTGDKLPFASILSQDAIVSELNRFHPEFRDRAYSPLNTLLMFLCQCLCADGSCRQAVARANA